MKRQEAVIGPIVCWLEGPIPISNRSKTLTFNCRHSVDPECHDSPFRPAQKAHDWWFGYGPFFSRCWKPLMQRMIDQIAMTPYSSTPMKTKIRIDATMQ